jgi:hypothetical protein
MRLVSPFYSQEAVQSLPDGWKMDVVKISDPN